MALRESLSNKPWIATGAAILFLILAGGLVASSVFTHGAPTAREAKSFYTVDDGATWFTDSPTLVPPFEHDGKTAVRVYVFQSQSGKPFAGYLMRYSASAKKKLDADPKAIQRLDPGSVEVKKPVSNSNWASQISEAGSKAQMVVSPDGQKDISLVNPQ